jgi:hypothetical protein
MAWKIVENADGEWDWSIVLTAYGAILGTSPTKAMAKVDLWIAQQELLEAPFPEVVCTILRERADEVAAQLPEPPETNKGIL